MILAGAKCLGSEVTLSISIHYKEVLYYVTLIESFNIFSFSQPSLLHST
jgi:hypothetical protein